MRNVIWIIVCIVILGMEPCSVSAGDMAQVKGRAVVFPWVELIGFDNTAPDYGVGAYLSRMVRKPDAISLLLDSDLLLRAYSGTADGDFVLPPNSCSYRGRPYNEERRRQNWKASQLKGLVAELKRQDIEVYAAFFYYKQMEMVDDCVADLARQFALFLTDFGFTGLHGCDGFSPPIHCLEAAERRALKSSDDPNRPKVARAEAVRFADAWRTIVRKLKEKGLKCYVNTCWTLDPYEALFRYGVDYRLLAATGIDGFVVESSAGSGRLFRGPTGNFPTHLDRTVAMLMRLKAMCPQVPLILLHTIHDGAEQWSAIRHHPSAMRGEALAMGGVFYGNSHALDGFLPCLSDGITAEEWKMLFKTWDLALAPAKAPFGFRYVWSDRAFDREFDACAATLDCSSSTFLAYMIKYGAMINSSVSVPDALADLEMPLLIVNPKFFPEDELAALRKRRAPVQLVGLGSGPPDCHAFELHKPATREYPRELFGRMLPENLPPQDIFGSAVWKSAFRDRLSTSTPELRLTAYWLSNGRLAVLARNGDEKYLNAKVEVGLNIADVLTHTDFPTAPVKDTLSFRVAPQDTVVFSLGVHEPTLPGRPVVDDKIK